MFPERPPTDGVPGAGLIWVEGRLDRVLWASPNSGYAVVRVTTVEEMSLIAVGPIASLGGSGEGTFVSLEGRYETHPVHGRQFRVVGLLESTPQTLDGMRLWLASSGIKGLGPALAKRLVEAYGHELPKIIRESPERLLEIDGIGAQRAEAIQDAWSSDEEGRALMMLLRGLGLSQRLADRIRERYGEQAAHIVRTQPFRLAEQIGGVGFRTADQLAQRQGLPADDPARVRAAAVYVLDQAADQQGHCFLPVTEMARLLADLSVPTDHLDEALATLEGTGHVVNEPERAWRAALFFGEARIAQDLLALAARPPTPMDDVEKAIADAERYEGVTLDPSQREAVELGLQGGISVVTGGPGTGKTTLLKVMLRAFAERGQQVRLASPTGRAARRLEEATGLPASTIHRMLEFNPGEGGFQRTVTHPLEADVVVVDEASMVDLELMCALLEACPVDRPQFALVLVGDADQLPSVGPGQILRDIVSAGAVNVARLTTVHRQAQDSGILDAAQRIHRGEVPISGEVSGADDVFCVARDDPQRARDAIVRIVAERLPAKGFEALRDVQVLAPTRRGPLGTQELNRVLQATLNPKSEGLKRGDREYRVRDRVLCTKNRYDVEVFNGDVGVIRDLHKGALEIDFDGRVVRWERDDLNMLDLAYAMTVHKSQGSEYPAVVLALHHSHGIMLKRNLFYTASTRAKRFLCIVGSPRAWTRAVRTQNEDDRHTALAARLTDGAADQT
ncbi:MAG: ATP-dependent RecD-like DNA helicase [Myxococcota bacterium]